jgi:transcription initiation factor IIE alpha subunit
MKVNNFRSVACSFILLMTATVICYSQNDSSIKNKKKEDIKIISDSCHAVQTVYYTCPVHSKVRSDKAGNCPQCGTTMDKKKEVVFYSCPIHSDEQYNKEGNCEKCGSALKKKVNIENMIK